jgi:soluble lytic murein transglycosylase-like protein
MKWCGAPQLAAASLVWLSGLSVRAAEPPLWGYVDAQGVAHFSSKKEDSRYTPVLRQSGEDVGRVPGKVASRQALLTWLAFAPEVKALLPILREAEAATGVDVELMQALIAVESGFKPDLVSPKGAIGLMQITPDTGERYATKAERAARPVEERLRDPRSNIMAGARMLADLSRRMGGIAPALAAWNAGEGKVRRHGGKVPPFAETEAHVHLVLEIYWELLQQRQQRKVKTMNLVSTTVTPTATLR